ncbi:hypothetical protein [Brevundimonas sp. R86498]|uniref:hypothetical protein n=1 Tax=Brevundimonas sp. R86498 TaxID=3093845 RepID=UPI0037C7D242
MKRIMAALALSAATALTAACGRDGETGASIAPEERGGTTTPAPFSSTAGVPAAPGAPAFAVLYPGASLDDPALSASGPAGPGGLVTYTTEADPAAVIAFYEDRAAAAGLLPVMAMNQGDARAYGAADPDGDVTLQVVASLTEAGTTSVQLTWVAGA